MILQQAIFTSAHTSRSDGYHLVARSQGIDPSTARALAAWGPSHDSLRPGESGGVSFFRLPSGDHCLARTTREEPEHSGRGDRQHTQMLVISPVEFAKVEQHPMVIDELARGWEQYRTAIPESEFADEVELPWPNTRLELDLLHRAAQGGVSVVPAICEALSESQVVGLVHVAQPLPLLAGLFFWLPREVRPDISFTTCLKASPRRPFRLICLDDKPAELRQHARRGIKLLDVSDEANHTPTPPDGWRAVLELAASG